MSYNKIIIIGDACRGKTTLARKMSLVLGIPHFSTDDFLYEVKFTKLRDPKESLERIFDLYKNEKWIVEGSAEQLLTPGLALADHIIFLRFKNIFIQWLYIIRRYIKSKNIKFLNLLDLLRHVFYKRYGLSYRRGERKYHEVLIEHKDKVRTISSFKEINTFIKSLV